MTLSQLRDSLELHESRRVRANKKYKAARKGSASAIYWLAKRKYEWRMVQRRKKQIAKQESKVPKITTSGGARGIVEDAYRVARAAGGPKIYVASSYRPGSITSGGNVSDHTGNNTTRAARDIARQGYNAIHGPPTPELDRAVAAVGKAFGRSYGDAKHRIVDTFHWKGYRIQIIWRTPEFGGHMGHLHVGAKRI